MWHWNIPPVYCSVVANHHSEMCDPNDTLTNLVRLVNFNSMRYNLNPYPQSIQPLDVNPEIDALNVSEAALNQLEADMCSTSV